MVECNFKYLARMSAAAIFSRDPFKALTKLYMELENGKNREDGE